MTDTLSKKQRSKNMTLIRSFKNKSTELALVSLMRRNEITGWRRHLKHLTGKPDFAFMKNQVAVFVDGCFWHGCRKCKLSSKSNKGYWIKKIENNKKRDATVKKDLLKNGWKVIRIWEHEIKTRPDQVLERIDMLLNDKFTGRYE